jgi:hypothetical protein
MRNCLPESQIFCRIGAKLLLFGIIGISSGCGLVSYHPRVATYFDFDTDWYELKTPSAPESPSELAAAQAAESRHVVKIHDISAICLAANERKQLVVTVSGTSRLSNPLSPKEITYYRFTRGNIDAFSYTVQEPSPDVEYERTIFNAASTAKVTNMKEVILYSHNNLNLTVVSHASGCIAKVSIISGFSPSGELLSVRYIPICSD